MRIIKTVTCGKTSGIVPLNAKLRPVRLEVGAPIRGRPSFRWVDGYQVITPEGSGLQPYMRKREAKAFCKAQGWHYEIVATQPFEA